MSVSRSLLGLLEAAPRHGYDLKRAHDELFRAERPLAYGQVYATLSRFLKRGWSRSTAPSRVTGRIASG